MSQSAWIVEAVRTPRGRGSARGALAGVPPLELVAQLLAALVERVPLEPGHVDDLVLGCVTAVGEQGANLARTAVLYAGWPEGVGGATVNRFCASGLDAVAAAAARLQAGWDDVVIAGGVESMSRVPMFADRGAWFEDPEVARRTGFVHMGVAADLMATRAALTREDLDAYAAESQRRASRARAEGRFARSLVPVRDPASGEVVLDEDELPRPATSAETLAALPPAFAALDDAALAAARARYPELARIDARHTLGTSPAVADGAALVLLANDRGLARLGVAPRGRVLGAAQAASEPREMLAGNLPASRRALASAGIGADDVALWEVNESFAVVPLHYLRAMGIDRERLNPNGGAIALGHPLGATGAILVGAALDELERRRSARALVSVCGGAGVASSLVMERA